MSSIVTDISDINVDDIRLAKEVGDVLWKHYPGYVWRVEPDMAKTGCVIIRCPTVSASYGYLLYASTVYQDASRRSVVRAGGEILERAKMRRGEYNGDSIGHVDGMKDSHQAINGVVVR